MRSFGQANKSLVDSLIAIPTNVKLKLSETNLLSPLLKRCKKLITVDAN